MDYVIFIVLGLATLGYFLSALVQWDTNTRVRNLDEYATGENNLTKHHALIANRNIELAFQLEKLRHQLKQETARANHHRERCRRLRVEHRQLLSRIPKNAPVPVQLDSTPEYLDYPVEYTFSHMYLDDTTNHVGRSDNGQPLIYMYLNTTAYSLSRHTSISGDLFVVLTPAAVEKLHRYLRNTPSIPSIGIPQKRDQI